MQLHFGTKAWALPDTAIASIRRDVPALEDLPSAIDLAVTSPLDFSRLDQAIVPGDIVALAVDPAVPRLPEIVSGIAQWLVEHGTPPENIRIVVTADCGRIDPLLANLNRLGLASVVVERHDPDDPQQLSYLAANDSADAIYVNRTLVDADIVLPISCARSIDAIDYLGPFGIFPLFSSRATLGHLRCYSRLAREGRREVNLSKTRQAAWWLGLVIAIQVIPTAQDQVAAILCGTLETVEATAQQLLASGRHTSPDLPEQADLVIAVVDTVHQDWSQVARALHRAHQACSLGGSIVLCTDLSQPIGSGLRRLGDNHSSPEQVERRLARECSDDALAASIILDATRDHHVYLVSEHSSQTIERLGLGVLSEAKQLSSLLGQHSRKLVIYSAQHP